MYSFCWEAIKQPGPDPDAWSTDFVDNNFSIHNDPVSLALLPTMAMALARADIAAGQQVLALRYTPEEVLDAYSGVDETGWQVSGGGLPTQLGYLYRVRRDFSAAASPASPLGPGDYLSELGIGAGDVASPFLSSTGELLLDGDLDGTPDDPRARLVVRAPRLQGAIGDFGGQTETRAPLIEITVNEGFAAVLLASRDGADLDRSSLMLLTTVARGENSGQQWNGARTNVTEMGHGPTRLERVTGAVTLHGRGDLGDLVVYQTDSYGFKTRRVVPEVQRADELRFAIGGAVWYAVRTLGEPDMFDVIVRDTRFLASSCSIMAQCSHLTGEARRIGTVRAMVFVPIRNRRHSPRRNRRNPRVLLLRPRSPTALRPRSLTALRSPTALRSLMARGCPMVLSSPNRRGCRPTAAPLRTWD